MWLSFTNWNGIRGIINTDRIMLMRIRKHLKLGKDTDEYQIIAETESGEEYLITQFDTMDQAKRYLDNIQDLMNGGTNEQH